MKVLLITLLTKLEDVSSEWLDDIRRAAIARLQLDGVAPLSHVSAYYQLLTGLSPEWTGIYDEVNVKAYQPTLIELSAEVERRLAWNIVQSLGLVGCKIEQMERLSAEMPCDFVYFDAQSPRDVAQIQGRVARGSIILLAILQSGGRSCGVNLNNFLADKGIIERNEKGTINWEETLAYYAGHGQIWINVAGREQEGIVTPGQQYAQVRDAVAKMIEENLLDPAGKPVVAAIRRKEDLYKQSGEHFLEAPDLAVEFADGYAPTKQSVQLDFDPSTIDAETSASQLYAAELLVWGKNARRNFGNARLIDVLPTILYMLDLPIPQSLSGEIITAMFAPDALERHPPKYQTSDDTLTAEEEAILFKRLKNLGYIG